MPQLNILIQASALKDITIKGVALEIKKAIFSDSLSYILKIIPSKI